MAATQVIHVIPKDLLQDYVADTLPVHSTLMASGSVEVDTAPPFTQGGRTYQVPKLKALTEKGDDQPILPNTEMSVKNVSSYTESGVIVRYGDVLGFEDTATIVAGKDIFGMVSPQLTEVIARDTEKKIIAAIKGCFGVAALQNTHQLDHSTQLFGLIGLGRAKAKLGEGRHLLKWCYIHSDQGAYLEEQGLVKYLDVQGVGAGVLLTGTFPTASGMMFLENNELCAPTNGVYPAYLMGGAAAKPIYLGFQRNTRIEYDRDIRLGGGTDLVKWDSHYSPAIRGMSWGGAQMDWAAKPNGPQVADLADYRNWVKVATKKEDILIVRYLSRIEPE
jgi:hypothetical protein